MNVCADAVAGCNTHWLQGRADAEARQPRRLLHPIRDGRAGNPCLLAYDNGYTSVHRPNLRGEPGVRLRQTFHTNAGSVTYESVDGGDTWEPTRHRSAGEIARRELEQVEQQRIQRELK